MSGGGRLERETVWYDGRVVLGEGGYARLRCVKQSVECLLSECL